MGDFILNVVHRPEMVPEYAQKLSAQGGAEDLNDRILLRESLDIFKLQQQIAHENGIKTTIQMTYASLFSDEAVELAKSHSKKFGDEIGLTLLGLPCQQFREKYKTKDFCIWMFSMEDKIAIVNDVFQRFYQCFGHYPSSTGSYYMDAELINYIKSRYPSVKCAVATCWEEGPKAYRTCNNSWYTFLDGGPWNPWIPSKVNTHVPAENTEEDSGIVAIPHLSRDLIACFDGNGSNFGTHPQNVLRGMIYEGEQFPYLFNIIDQYRSLEKYNQGYSYNMMFVGPGWMNKLGRWEASHELLVKSYRAGMEYYAKLKREGKLTDMTMSEFADYYRSGRSYTRPECALWKDILYGSEKQLFWYADPYMRACADMNQGGALVDLRPYAAKLGCKVGIDTGNIHNVSYPYIVQSMYRAGYFTHYAGEGSIKSCKISFEGEEVDLCLCRTKARFSQNGGERRLELEPMEVEFATLKAVIGTSIIFEEGSSQIRYRREVLSLSRPAEITVTEYLTGCYGTTEYPEDMTGIRLELCAGDEIRKIDYAYKCREEYLENADACAAVIPQISTKIMLGSNGASQGFIREGYAFSPMFTLGLSACLKEKEGFETWLKLERED